MDILDIFKPSQSGASTTHAQSWLLVVVILVIVVALFSGGYAWLAKQSFRGMAQAASGSSSSSAAGASAAPASGAAGAPVSGGCPGAANASGGMYPSAADVTGLQYGMNTAVANSLGNIALYGSNFAFNNPWGFGTNGFSGGPRGFRRNMSGGLHNGGGAGVSDKTILGLAMAGAK